MTDIFDKNVNNLKNTCDDRDSIPMRIQFIKNLLDGKDLQSLVNFDSTDTENFICKNSNEFSIRKVILCKLISIVI